MFVFLLFAPKIVVFAPRLCLRDKKGQKNYVPRVSGAQTRDKFEFFRFAYSNRKINLSNYCSMY